MAKKLPENYQQNKKCPKCGRRKIYVSTEGDGYKFSCKSCGYTWKV